MYQSLLGVKTEEPFAKQHLPYTSTSTNMEAEPITNGRRPAKKRAPWKRKSKAQWTLEESVTPVDKAFTMKRKSLRERLLEAQAYGAALQIEKNSLQNVFDQSENTESDEFILPDHTTAKKQCVGGIKKEKVETISKLMTKTEKEKKHVDEKPAPPAIDFITYYNTITAVDIKSEKVVDETSISDIKAEKVVDEIRISDIKAEKVVDEISITDIKAEKDVDEISITDTKAEKDVDEMSITDIKAEKDVDEISITDIKAEKYIDDVSVGETVLIHPVIALNGFDDTKSNMPKESAQTLVNKPKTDPAITNGKCTPAKDSKFEMKLKNVDLPVFNNNKRTWLKFMSEYKTKIYNKKYISKKEKYYHLYNNVDKKARKLLEHLPMEGDSLEKALDILKSNYDKRTQIDIYLSRILNLPAFDESRKDSSVVEDILRPVLESREVIKQFGINTWDYLYLHVTLSKLPKKVKDAFEAEYGGLGADTCFTDLIVYLQEKWY